ncbi:hypothetical protein BJY24_002754 [Nocardia transvalensis]|uniref:Uncharacterized protein n=1 Tax=Nocardia transvalensis TaxID=37333 RepID=A0A7W9PD15_9NOCA|nr:hypothetical protein [Nocardia transvalensis]MBB5913887.1 hypothetical protein [Nocardia transvalensis]
MSHRDITDLYTNWAIVTTGPSCNRGDHPPGACPVAVWGPYTRYDAEQTRDTIPAGLNPHIVPFFPRGGQYDIAAHQRTGLHAVASNRNLRHTDPGQTFWQS